MTALSTARWSSLSLRLAVVALALCAAATPCARAQPALAAVPGLRLPRNVVPLAYDARLELDPARAAFAGGIDITVRVLEPTDLVWLNAKELAIGTVRAVPLAAPSEEIAGTVVSGSDDVIGLQFAKVLPAGEVRLSLAFTGTADSKGGIGLFRQQEAGRWYMLTQFEPMDARRAFPCFDEPDRKAPWRLTLVVPAGLRAFANMPVEAERTTSDGRREVTFLRSPPLPSYLVAFAVGEFDVLDAGRAGQNGTPISVVAPKGRAAEGAYIASKAGAILAATEHYFGMPYPFPKLDLLAYPRATFGGAMENAGLITYDSRELLARPDELSPGLEQRLVGFTAHEIAHQWFGDYVTMAWWDDVWLNEAFASWLSTTIVSELRPDWSPDGWRAFQRARAIDTDRLASARRVRQPVNEPNEVRAAFDGITYAKGEIVIGMFERWLTRDKFREGVRRYVAQHAWGNATADDFFSALGADDESLVPAFRGFVERPGVPVVDVALDCAGPPALKLAQRRLVPPGAAPDAETRWVFPACFDFGDGKRSAQVCTVVREATQTLPLPGAACPAWVVANRDGRGYYLPRLSPALYAALPQGERALSSGDLARVVSDLDLLAGSGIVPFREVLPVAVRTGAHPDAGVARRGYDLANVVPEAMIDPANETRYAAYVRHHLGDRARALGWLPVKGDSADVLRLREAAVPFVADRGGDAALARKASQLAARWIEHRSAIPPGARRMVLVAAAHDGGAQSAALFEGLAAIARTGRDGNEREDAIAALGAFRDPALRSRALVLTLDPQVPARSATTLLAVALEDAHSRPATLSWLAANVDALSARVPREQQSRLIRAANGACTADERAQFVALFETRAATWDAGPRRYREALERIDACLALRRAQQASFNAFLAAAR